MDKKIALNAEIRSQGHSDAQLSRPVPNATAKKTRRVANTAVTEWSLGVGRSEHERSAPGRSFLDQWPEHLPRPPSMKRINADSDDAAGGGTGGGAGSAKSNIPRVIVFNANTQEGSSMVRVLSEKGLQVVAVVRVFTSRNTKQLIKLKNVTVKVADLNNFDAVLSAAEGCSQAFLVTKYWERFENIFEEQMAKVVVTASAQVGIRRFVLATFEDTHELRIRGRKSQIIPTPDGRIFPSFDGMESISQLAKSMGVHLTHMMTSYLDDKDHKKSLILIRGENGKIITQPYVQEVDPNKKK